MEGSSAWDLSLLLRLLTQGEEQTRHLEATMEAPSPPEHCKTLVQQIKSTLEEAITMAKLMDLESPRQPACPNNAAAAASDSPRSNSGSPRSENSERFFKEHERREMCKKRKTLPKWTNQVRVSGSGVVQGLEDGYSWRKYGQKEILGARHPRGYYRCTHRNSVGCLATKQVQISDEDPFVFNITYRGEHTCLEGLQTAPVSAPKEPALQQNHGNPPLIHEVQHPPPCSRPSLEVKTESLDMQGQCLSSSFSFPSTPLGSFGPQNQMFSSAMAVDTNFVGSFSPPFISPTTSESNYFSLPPSGMSSYGGGMAPNTSESDLTEIISAATSTTNSPRLDTAFMLDHVDFDPIFPFDVSKFI